MHLADIPSGSDFIEIIRSRNLAISRVRSAWSGPDEQLQQDYGIKRGEPVLVTTNQSRGESGDRSEEFVFGQLDAFTYSTEVDGLRLQILEPIGLRAEQDFIVGVRAIERPPIMGYYHLDFTRSSQKAGYRLACGTLPIQDVLNEFGLNLAHVLRLQDRAYFRVSERPAEPV